MEGTKKTVTANKEGFATTISVDKEDETAVLRGGGERIGGGKNAGSVGLLIFSVHVLRRNDTVTITIKKYLAFKHPSLKSVKTRRR